MAVKFSQFSSISPSASTFLVGYDGSLNVKVPYSSLVGGSGTTNYLPKWTGSTALGNSLVFDDGTNVGINTSSPLNPIGTGYTVLHIRGQATGQTGALFLDNSNNTIRTAIYQNSANFTINVISGQNITFNTSNTQRAQIGATTGNFLIGTSVDGGYKLDVTGTFRSTLDANINGLTVGRGGGSVASNTVVGSNAGVAITTATLNTLIGFNAGRNITNEGANTFVGWYSGQSLNTGYYNTAVGVWSLTSATSGHSNVAIGMQAGEAINSGRQNVFVGMYAGSIMTTSIGSTIVGYNTGLGITTGNYNTIIGANVTGLSSSLSNTIILADGQGNQRLYINSSGEAMIGSTTDQGDFKLQVTGQQVIQGVLTAGSPFPNFGYVGVLELKSSNQNALSVYGIKFNNTNTGSAFIGISADNASTYSRPSKSIIHKADGHVFYNSSDVNLFSIFPSTGNISVNSATDAGYKLDVNGTARFVSVVYADARIETPQIRPKSGQATVTMLADYFYVGTGGTLDGNPYMRLFATNTVGNITGTGTAVLSSMTPTINQTVGATASIIGYRFNPTNTAVLSKVWSFYADSGQGFFNDGIAIGTTSPNASALLDITSTTKGFLPPRMTGAQAEAIATPAEGLMVYSTDGSGVTITSAGWWGYSGGWVKLN